MPEKAAFGRKRSRVRQKRDVSELNFPVTESVSVAQDSCFRKRNTHGTAKQTCLSIEAIKGSNIFLKKKKKKVIALTVETMAVKFIHDGFLCIRPMLATCQNINQIA